jgi:N-acetylmuramoyl-L-alanine amidase
MRKPPLVRAQRALLFIGVVSLAGIVLIGARVAGFGLPDTNGVLPQGFDPAAFNRQIYLVSGHAGNDSGAVCLDDEGEATLTEADVNARVAELAAARLRRAGADVEILKEYDPRLNGLEADVFLSIHADSCIDASGYKAATYQFSVSQAADARLLSCIDRVYSVVTQLPHHPNTVTHNMTEYHAFRKLAPNTPGAILELGFLGGDRDLLEDRPQIAAQGVADAILCFLQSSAAVEQAN